MMNGSTFSVKQQEFWFSLERISAAVFKLCSSVTRSFLMDSWNDRLAEDPLPEPDVFQEAVAVFVHLLKGWYAINYKSHRLAPQFREMLSFSAA